MKKLSVLMALLLVLSICLTGCQPQRMGVEEYATVCDQAGMGKRNHQPGVW